MTRPALILAGEDRGDPVVLAQIRAELDGFDAVVKQIKLVVD